MGRRLLNLLTGLSVLLLVVTALMSVRSYFVTDVWVRARATPVGRDGPAGSAAFVTDYVVSRGGGVLVRRVRGVERGLSFDPSAEPGRGLWVHTAGYVTAPAPVLPPAAERFSRMGLRVAQQVVRSPPPNVSFNASDTEVEVRYWLAALAAGVLPVVRGAWGVRRRAGRHGRLARGLCPDCGYDLRWGNGRCPECGAAGAGAWDDRPD
jgi:hypothetical protein